MSSFRVNVNMVCGTNDGIVMLNSGKLTSVIHWVRMSSEFSNNLAAASSAKRLPDREGDAVADRSHGAVSRPSSRHGQYQRDSFAR